MSGRRSRRELAAADLVAVEQVETSVEGTMESRSRDRGSMSATLPFMLGSEKGTGQVGGGSGGEGRGEREGHTWHIDHPHLL